MKKNSYTIPSIESESIESLSAKLLETTAKLSAANRELTRAQKEREEMLSNISHDLRAPITAIRSSLDYLQSGAEPTVEDYRQAFSIIDRRTKTLENLIQDMYYLFCVEDTSKELQFEELDALPFFETYYYDLLSNSCYDDFELVLEAPDTLSCKIRIDVQKMIRVLDNLFTNAAKYSGKGSRITLRLMKDSPSKTLFISVIDNGIGIPAEALPHIFSRTYTVSSSRTPGSATGSGLGLSIVKAIVERHDGTIVCESKEGEGSSFTISLKELS